LRETEEPAVELYGVWDGSFDFTMPPAIRDEIFAEGILGGFRFKYWDSTFVTVERADPVSR
jgi:hypothetical protein